MKYILKGTWRLMYPIHSLQLGKRTILLLVVMACLSSTRGWSQTADYDTTSPLAADLVSTTTELKHELLPLRDIGQANIGEFVAVEGTVAAYYPPPEPRAPYAFLLRDTQGDTMRVVTWPDIYERVDNHAALETTGTAVKATAEVAEYNDRLELHIADYEEITVSPQQDIATSTTLPVSATTGDVTTMTVTIVTTVTTQTASNDAGITATDVTSTMSESAPVMESSATSHSSESMGTDTP